MMKNPLPARKSHAMDPNTCRANTSDAPTPDTTDTTDAIEEQLDIATPDSIMETLAGVLINVNDNGMHKYRLENHGVFQIGTNGFFRCLFELDFCLLKLMERRPPPPPPVFPNLILSCAFSLSCRKTFIVDFKTQDGVTQKLFYCAYALWPMLNVTCNSLRGIRGG
ncbi:unnamed protein product [Absidia cylindrospora]